MTNNQYKALVAGTTDQPSNTMTDTQYKELSRNTIERMDNTMRTDLPYEQFQELKDDLKQHIQDMITTGVFSVSQNYLRSNGKDYNFNVSQKDIEEVLSDITNSIFTHWDASDLTKEQFEELRESIRQASVSYTNNSFELAFNDVRHHNHAQTDFPYTQKDVERALDSLNCRLSYDWKD